MALGVRVAMITRFFSVDKRSKEEKAADRKSALAKSGVMRKMLNWLTRRRLRQLLKRKGLHPKGLLADQRKSGKLRQFLCQVLGVKDLWEGLCPEAPGVDVEAGHHRSEQAPGRLGEAR
ncbi:unnamed protein product [Sphagnum troendelagicum]|uniref:Uncharacterized protein n=1 Tax=Sphagnum troendelagicum TaxID=128251 RepID=A0ABP0UB52_9BRYO